MITAGASVEPVYATPADGLQMFVPGLQAAGGSAAEIQLMARETPGALLMG